MRKIVGAPPNTPLVLLNVTRLHIKVLQLSKQGKLSSKIVKNKLAAATIYTECHGFDSD